MLFVKVQGKDFGDARGEIETGTFRGSKITVLPFDQQVQCCILRKGGSHSTWK
jgi:hypothetical protein